MQLPREGRSIPACAGEPPSGDVCAAGEKVYPRVCGGTNPLGPAPLYLSGLSPRVRGNPPAGAPVGPAGRSIPACAGEPQQQPRPAAGAAVYPRVCGGTYVRQRRVRPTWGLSPRVRGNPTLTELRAIAWGSIPACAGEP